MWTAGLSASWLTGGHTFKAGTEYRDSRWNIDQRFDTLMRFSDDYFFWFKAMAKGPVGTRTLSTFLQDSWRFSDRWRLNAGLRWDGQYIVASNGKVAQKFLDQWQPRVGLVFQPGEEGVHKVTASFGRFYQEVPLYPLFFSYVTNKQWDWITYDHDPRVDPSGADVISLPRTIQPETDLEGQHFDEITLGYERRVGAAGKAAARAIYRTLRQGLEDGYEPVNFEYHWGNPGRGDLSSFPKFVREYSALEVSYQQQAGDRLSLLASYVLSRSYGNYSGLFFSDAAFFQPNAGGALDRIEPTVDAEGLLPNDRPHVVKLAGSYRAGAGVTLGAYGSVSSGIPRNEKGAFPDGYPLSIFLQPRGTAGRTPSLWDLNFRVTYEPQMGRTSQWRPRLTIDFLHVGSQRTGVVYDDVHYFDVDAEGNQTSPNPTYGMPIIHQPPMAVRLGAEVAF